MSLLIAARYREGVLLASDPFVFDNDPVRPRRRLDFDRFHVAADQSVVFAAVGSLWVFREFCRRFDEKQARRAVSRVGIAALWSDLCTRWRSGRTRKEHGAAASLRALSDSLLIAIHREKPWRIEAITADGVSTSSRSFIVTGSAASWVRGYLLNAENRFDSRHSLERALELMRGCFAAGASDLYVVGFPALACVRAHDIVDCSHACAAAWRRVQSSAFEGLSRRVAEMLAEVATAGAGDVHVRRQRSPGSGVGEKSAPKAPARDASRDRRPCSGSPSRRR